MSDAIFYWTGVATCAVGAIGVLGWLLWQSIEMWIKFAKVRKPLLDFYAERLKSTARQDPRP